MTTSLGFTTRTDHRVLYLPCDCAYDQHYINLGFFLEEPDPEWQMLFVSVRNIPSTFWHRLKAAWKMVLGREYYFSEVVLEKNAIQQVRDFVEEFLSKYPS